MTPRERMALVRKIVEHVRPLTSGRADPDKVPTKAQVDLPPLLTKLQFEGVRLTDLMVPKMEVSTDLLEECFAATLFKRLKPGVVDGDDPTVRLPAAVRKFVGRSPERFVIWAGSQRGWNVLAALDPDGQADSYPTLIASSDEVSIGIRKGELLSRFRDYLSDTQWVPDVEGVTLPQRLHSKDLAFTVLYGRLAPDSYERQLLGAARYAYPHQFSSLVPWLFSARHPAGQALVKIIVSDDWPLRALCDHLVPSSMTLRTFYRTFGCPDRWTKRPPEYVRERIYLKLRFAGIVE